MRPVYPYPPYYVGQAPRTASGRQENLAVLALEVVTVAMSPVDWEATEFAREMTDALRSAASRGPYAVASHLREEQQHLIDLKLMHGCPDDRASCMAKVGRALGVDHLVYGNVERRPRGAAAPGRGYQVSLRLLDVADGHLATSIDFVPTSEATGAPLAERGRRIYAELLVRARALPSEAPSAPDRVLVNATNEAFWRVTRYKPNQPLDMSDPQDRVMAGRWREIYEQIRGYRTRATAAAQRTHGETRVPYVLVLQQRDGNMTSQTFPRRGNLDVQYEWLLDQPEYYTYVAMFDLGANRDAPVRDQFSITQEARRTRAVSGWYGWSDLVAG